MNPLRVHELTKSTRGLRLTDEINIVSPGALTLVGQGAVADVFWIEHSLPWIDNCFDRAEITKRAVPYVIDLVPETALESLANKHSVLVIDGSTEGGAQWSALQNLKQEIEKKGIPASQVILISANFHQRPSPFSMGELEIFYHNVYFHKGTRLASEYCGDTPPDNLARIARIGNGKDFICLNFSIRPHRVMFVSSFIADGIFDNGFISFSDLNAPLGWKVAMNTSRDAVRETLKRLYNAEGDVLEAAEILRSKGRLVVDTEIDNPVHLEFVTPHELNINTWFSVVTETEMGDGEDCFVTEKTIKPISMAQPFIIGGNPGSLNFVRSIGYHTFHRWIYEGYDSEYNAIKRISMVRKEVRRLCNLSISDKKEIVAEMRPILEHNWWNLKQNAVNEMHKKWTKPLLQGIRSRIVSN